MLKKFLLTTLVTFSVNVALAMPFIGCAGSDLGPDNSVAFSVVDESGYTIPVTHFVPAGQCQQSDLMGVEGSFRVQATIAQVHMFGGGAVFCSINVYRGIDNPSQPLAIALDDAHSGFMPGPCIN